MTIESLNSLGQAKYFTKLDLTNIYHWMRIKKFDKWKTAFRTLYNYFRYQIMFFELWNAPTSFQDYINKIMAKKPDVFMIVYLDNILIYIKDETQAYINIVWLIFVKLEKYNLYANSKKFYFYKDEIPLLKYVMLGKRISIKDKKIKTIRNWPKLKLVRDIQIFLCFANFYWCSIYSFSKIAGLLIFMV